MEQEPTPSEEPVQAPQAPSSPKVSDPPLLSLCMIARDNERTIHDALASAKPWVDEMIVVDTGSTDQTPTIARDLGARVESFPWCDNFAVARNESLGYATGQWLFWMDTDDTLPPECGKLLREALEKDNGPPPEVMGLIMQVHCPPATGSAIASEQSEEKSQSVTIVDHVKVLRNLPDLRFEGRIHEQILPAIRRAGGRIQWTDSYVVHSGVDHSPKGLGRKLDRDLRLLRLDLQDRPNHPFVLFNLGMTLLHCGEYPEAKTALEDCINRSTTDESHLRKAYALLADALDHLGERQTARQRCWEGLGRYPEDPELAFKLGRLLMLNKEWKEAIDAFRRILNRDSERYFASIDPGIKGHKTFANLATCHEELGQWHESIGAWRSCLNDIPDFIDAWEGVLRGSRAINDLGPLIQFADELKEQAPAQCFVLVCEALILDTRDDDAKAIERFESAIALDSQRSFVLNAYARFLNEREQWESSLAILRQLRSLGSANPSPHYNLGICMHQLGQYKQAGNALHAALQLRPGHQPTRELISECNQQLSQMASGIPSPTQIVLAPCFMKQTDPQRGTRWDEQGDLAVLIDHWIRGITDLNLSGVILYDGLSESFVAERSSKHITFHNCKQPDNESPNDSRFGAFQHYLNEHPEIEQVFCTDLFDVQVARNPFELMADSQSLFIGVEPTTIGNDPWLQQQWQNTWGTLPPEKFTDKLVLNTGVFGGERDAILKLCNSVQQHIQNQKDANVRHQLLDMPIFNHVLYQEIGEEHFWAGQTPLHSVFKSYEYERDDVAFIHK